MTHRELNNFWKFWATGKDHGQNFVSKMPDDSETCKDIGEFCLCNNYNK